MLIGREIDIVIPFEDLTKAEVIATSKLNDFSETHSCISQRFGDHCGTCFGCVIKRLAEIINGVKGVDDKKDIFDEESDEDYLLDVLWFSEKILFEPEKMSGFQREKIDEFDKWVLFRRYAKDNLAALMIATKQGNLFYNRFIKKEIVPLLKNRIEELKENKKNPDFGNIIK